MYLYILFWVIRWTNIDWEIVEQWNSLYIVGGMRRGSDGGWQLCITVVTLSGNNNQTEALQDDEAVCECRYWRLRRRWSHPQKAGGSQKVLLICCLQSSLPNTCTTTDGQKWFSNLKTGLNSFPRFPKTLFFATTQAPTFPLSLPITVWSSLLPLSFSSCLFPLLNPSSFSPLYFALTDFLKGQKRASRRKVFAQQRLLVTANYLLPYWQRVSLCVLPDLFLQVRLSEGEQELLDVFGAQAVDAACVDGPTQELVHLVLGVQVFLRVSENEMPE